MNGLVLLLYCIEILGAVLCGAEKITVPATGMTGMGQNDSSYSDTTVTFLAKTVAVADPTSAASGMSETSTLMYTESPTTVSNSRTTPPSPGPQPTTTTRPNGMFYRKECLPMFMVTGGLIIACAILLVSTLLLAWKVCQLSRRIKALSSNADLISNSEYWMGTAKKNKSKSEAEAKETSLLMADVSQTQEEMGNGSAKEEGEANKGGQMGNENEKEVGDVASVEEASTTPVAVAEKSSPLKPQEKAADSQSTKAASEGTEEPKDVV